jgi:hypothetical protein
MLKASSDTRRHTVFALPVGVRNNVALERGELFAKEAQGILKLYLVCDTCLASTEQVDTISVDGYFVVVEHNFSLGFRGFYNSNRTECVKSTVAVVYIPQMMQRFG